MSKIKSTSSSSPTFKLEDHTSTGTGVIGVGKFLSRSFHTLTSKTDIHRYHAFVIQVSGAHSRVLNKFGTEDVPENLKKDGPTKLDNSKLLATVGGENSPVAKSLGVGSDVLSHLHPTVSGAFVFWIELDQVKNAAFKDGEEVIFRTQGNSIFLSKLFRTDLDNFEGMANGKLLSQISSKTDYYADGDKPLPGEDKEGVAEEEWD